MEATVDTLEAQLYNADCKLNVIIRQLESELASLDVKWQEQAQEHNVNGPAERPMINVIRMTTLLERMRESLGNLRSRYAALKEDKEKFETDVEEKCNRLENEMIEFAQQYGLTLEDLQVSDEEEVEPSGPSQDSNSNSEASAPNEITPH